MIINVDLIIILAIFILSISILSIISFSIILIKNQTRVNGLTVWFFGCFAGSIILDCIRVIIILGVGGYYPTLDTVAFIAKIIAIFVSFTLVIEIHIVLRNYVGDPQKHQTLIRYYLVALAIIFCALIISFSNPTPSGEFGFYIFQVDSIIYVITFIFYLPVALLIFFRKLLVLLSLTNIKAIYYKLVLFTLLAFFLIGERGYNIGGYSLVYSILGIPIELSLVLDFIALTVISAMFLIVILKFPDFMESIGTFYSIKKLYILKDNGLLIFDHDFDENRFRDGLTSEESLIGGFIYAITEGLKDMLKTSEDINSITSGDRSVVIERGEFIFGVLIVTDDSPLMHRKLIEFIKKFETNYKEDLETWIGEFTKFDRDKIQKWIIETLR